MLLENVKYIDANNCLVDGHIRISGNKIAKISSVPLRKNGSEEIISGKNKLLIPGLMNTHTHIAMTLFRGFADDLPLKEWLETKIFPAEKNLTEEAVYYGSLQGIAELIHSGCTFFNDMYFFADQTADAIVKSGIRAILSPGITDFSSDNVLEQIIRLHGSYATKIDAGGRIKVYFGPHAPYTCSIKTLEKISEAAKSLNTGIHIHLNETLNEVAEFSSKNSGLRPIEKFAQIGLFENKTIAAHCVHLSTKEQEILKKFNVMVSHNPSSNLKLASGIAPIQEYIDNGIAVSIGTDGASSNNQLNMVKEMHIASLIGKVAGKLNPLAISADTAFNMATKIPGNWIYDGQVGTIKEGSIADVVFIDIDTPSTVPALDPISNLVYASTGTEADTVIIDGECVMKNKIITTFDEEYVRRETQKISTRITKKRGYLL
ncbi:MAG: amidohydrolase [Caldisericia bacterium]|nr:amidohydrolase [Caldisericia bacterium]